MGEKCGAPSVMPLGSSAYRCGRWIPPLIGPWYDTYSIPWLY